MFRCVFCNKFSLLLNEKEICSRCFNTYSSQAIRVCEDEINPLFAIIETPYVELERRKESLDKLKVIFENFMQRPDGKIWAMYNSFSYQQTELQIRIDERKLNEEIRKVEILKYSKVEASPSDYIVFDLETTGFDCESDAILEIGAIKYVNNIESGRFHTYINPQRSIPRAASAVNHITAAKVRNAPLVKSALEDFLLFIGDYPLIAYNSDFDMKFIQMKCTYNLGKKVQNDVIDALPLARKYLPQLPNKKLETVKQHFGLNVGSHNALDDCFVTNYLYQYCRQFEELRYRYAVRFLCEPRVLSDKEVEYLNTIVSICEKSGINRSQLSMRTSRTTTIIIEKNNETVVGFKMDGKLQYVLLQIPFEQFEANYPTEIKHTPSIKSEGNCTRLFVTNTEQLWQFESVIIKKRQRNWTTA